jgi:hypothetical protein
MFGFEQAQNIIVDWLEEHRYLSENEDIAAVGLDIKTLDANGSLDVQDSRRKASSDIRNN